MSDDKNAGGVSFGHVKGNVNVDGDIVGRDKISTTTTQSGLDAQGLALLQQAFRQAEQKIEALPDKDAGEKQELKDTVKKIEDEVAKGEEAKPDKVERWLKFIAGMSGDIAQVVGAALLNPAAAVGTAIRLVAQRAVSTDGTDGTD